VPKLRVSEEEKNDRVIRAKIKVGMEINNLSIDDMCIATGVSKKTWFNRMNNPAGFTVMELRRISKKLRIPAKNILDEQISM